MLVIIDGENKKEHEYLIPKTKVDRYDDNIISIISLWGSDTRVSSSGVCNTFDSYSYLQLLHVTMTTIRTNFGR